MRDRPDIERRRHHARKRFDTLTRPVNKEDLELAHEALERMKARPPQADDEWAEILAVDLGKFRD